jgi:hypothetical protein
LAPSSIERAEVVILDGSQILKNGAINAGLRLLLNGKAKRLFVVIHQPPESLKVFVLEREYAQLLVNESDRIGLEKVRFQIVVVPSNGHPVTLNEARFVVTILSKDEIRSAILLSKGFHTRRNFGVYSQEGARVGLRIIPLPYFNKYKDDNWWQHAEGVHDLFEQYIKLFYYVIRGYISIRYLYGP